MDGTGGGQLRPRAALAAGYPDLLPARGPLVVLVLDVPVRLVAEARVVLNLDALEVPPVRGRAPVGHAASPCDLAAVAVVADRPHAQLDLHGRLGPLGGRDLADVPHLADGVVDGEAEELVGPFERVLLEGVEARRREVVRVVVRVEERLPVVEVVCLRLVVVRPEEFLRRCF